MLPDTAHQHRAQLCWEGVSTNAAPLTLEPLGPGPGAHIALNRAERESTGLGLAPLERR